MANFPKLNIPANVSDVAGWREFMRPMVEPWMNQAWIAIIDPINGRTVTENSKTGAVSTVSITPIWKGPARVQPLRTDITVKRAVNSTTQRPVQFWVDFPADEDIPDIRPGLEIAVVDGGNDPYLKLYKYLVVGSMNSSMAWQRTINTLVDEESRPNYDMTGWGP